MTDGPTNGRTNQRKDQPKTRLLELLRAAKKFKCMRCKEIVYKKDALKKYYENGQNCAVSAQFSATGKISGLVLP